jgi:hypothetical protein
MMAGMPDSQKIWTKYNKLSSFARCFYWLFCSLAIVPLSRIPGAEAHGNRTRRQIDTVSICR